MPATYILGIALQTASHELAERLGEWPFEARRGVLGDQEEDLCRVYRETEAKRTQRIGEWTNLHGMKLCIWRLALG